jgi:hypothetical protein
LPLSYVAVVGWVVRSSARPRQAALRAASVTLGLIFALGLLELAAAARLVHWELAFMALRGEEQDYVPDPDLGFRHAPSRRWSGRPRGDLEAACGLPASSPDRIAITYDERGYRNPTLLARAEVAVIGDSFIEGRYVSDDQVVSAFLEAQLRRPVANLGVAGYGTAQERIVLERDALPLEPRVVVWFFFEGNDLYNDKEFENALFAPREVRARAWTEGHGWWRRSLVRSAHRQLRLQLHPIAPGHCPHAGTLVSGPHRGQRVLFGPEAAVPWTDFEKQQWGKTRATIREGVGLARARDVHLLLVYVPIKFRVYGDLVDPAPGSELPQWTPWPLPELFAELCRAEEVPCLDLTEPLRRAVLEGGMPYAPVDSHWSPEGHRLVAGRLAGAFEALGWVRAR